MASSGISKEFPSFSDVAIILLFIVELEELRKQEHLMEEHAYLLLELYQNKNEQAKFNDLAEFIFYQAPTYDCYNILKSNVSKVKFQVKKEKYSCKTGK